jgi:protein-S-isoprenylcysteine O-methyltransferase Ste14
MNPLSPLRRRAPWIAGALVLALVGLPLIAAALRFGLQYWPFLVGAGAILVLLAGWLERLWQSRRLPRPRSHKGKHSRFRVLRGGRPEGRPAELDDDDDTDEPRWLM